MHGTTCAEYRVDLSHGCRLGYGLGGIGDIGHGGSGRPGSAGSFGWGGAATTTFTVNPVEKIAIVIMGQKMPNDDELLRKVESLVYQALVDPAPGR